MPEDKKYKILVVEDDPILKNLLGSNFSNTYEAMYANNGKEALSILETYKPDVILLDLMLPEMHGFDVLKEIRGRTDELKDVPVIIVSNLSQESDQQTAKELGANDYLVKAEVSVEEITARIKSFCA